MSATALVGQAPTILGSLTTLFTPPPSCTLAVAAAAPADSNSNSDGLLGGLGGLLGGRSGDGAGSVAFLGQTCTGGRPAVATTCWPSTTSGAPTPTAGSGGWGIYSPGIQCPVGYATACAATAGGATGWPMQFALRAGETAVGCCPR